MDFVKTIHFVCALLAFLSARCEGQLDFDCRVDLCNDGGGTSVGTCDASAPTTCACTNSQFNYNCLSATNGPCDSNVNGDCNPTTTFACPDASTCICDGQHYTDATTTDCSLKRLRATCTDALASFYYAPHSDFGGKAFFINAADDVEHPLCLLVEDSTTNIFEKEDYELTGSPSDGNCPMAQQTQMADVSDMDETNDDNIYVYKMRIQHYSDIFTSADLIVTFTCAIPPAGGIVEATVDIVSATKPEGIATPIVADAETGIEMDVQQAGVSVLGTQIAVAVGDLLDILWILTIANSPYTDFAPFRVRLLNHPHDAVLTGVTGNVEIVVMDNACVPSDMNYLVVALKKYDVGDAVVTVKLTINTFSFDSTLAGLTPAPPAGAVYLAADICVGTCTRTPAGDCPTDGSTLPISDEIHDVIAVTGPDTMNDPSRRRRSTEERSNINLNLSFVVQDPRFQTVPNNEGTIADPSNCYQSAAFLLPLILMGVVLVLSVISTFYFFSKVTRSKRGLEEGHTNMAYK